MTKTKLLLLGFICLAYSSFAQTDTPSAETTPVLVSKKGFAILPKAGDFGLGFDAVPFFNFVGNTFNNSTSNTVGATFPNNRFQIFGKYFLGSEGDAFTSLKAIRARVRIANSSDIVGNRVIQDNQTLPDPNATVEDQRTTKSTNIQLGAGMEWRRGYGRLYGIYGAELAFSFGSGKTEYEYGNPFALSNQTPTSTTNFDAKTAGVAAQRVASSEAGKTTGIGANAFVGVEYFFAPRISLSAEFSYGFSYVNTANGTSSLERWDGNTAGVSTSSTSNVGARSSNLDNGNYGGSINLLFYF